MFQIICSGCASSPANQGHFIPTGFNDSFDFQGQSFSSYVIHERKKLKLAREKAGVVTSQVVIEGNAPYEVKPSKFSKGKNKPYKKAIILIPGLTETPYLFKDISKYYAKKGFLVRTVLLPRHGSVVGDLMNVKHADWEAAVEFVVNDTLQIADNVHLGGNSTGAALSLLQAYDKPQIKSLMLFSPLVRIDTLFDYMGLFFTKFDSILPNINWMFRTLESSPYKYESLSTNALKQTYLITEKLKQVSLDRKLAVPVLMFAVREDDVVNTKKTISFFKSQASKKSSLILYSSKDIIFKDERIEIVRVNLEDPQIKSFAHEALLYHEENPTYGRHGTEKHCYGYLVGTDSYKKCLDPKLKNFYFGDSSSQIFSDGEITRRLTFNPRYEEMLDRISAFLRIIGA